jgi:hypothetical protein
MSVADAIFLGSILAEAARKRRNFSGNGRVTIAGENGMWCEGKEC